MKEKVVPIRPSSGNYRRGKGEDVTLKRRRKEQGKGEGILKPRARPRKPEKFFWGGRD